MWFSVRNAYFQIACCSYAEYQQYSSNIEYITVEYLWLTSISRIITVQWLQCIRQYVQRLGTKDDVTDYLSSNKFNCSIVLKEVFFWFFFLEKHLGIFKIFPSTRIQNGTLFSILSIVETFLIVRNRQMGVFYINFFINCWWNVMWYIKFWTTYYKPTLKYRFHFWNKQ